MRPHVAHVRGQALVVVALVLTVLSMLVLTALEVGGRYQQGAAVQDALQQATRSAVQTFDYAAFAQGAQRVRAARVMTPIGCTSLVPESVQARACAVFVTNLRGVRGLVETPDQTAARVQWTILPQRGTCTFPNGRPERTFATPAVCATVRPLLHGFVGWGDWSPQLDAADTLDRP